MWPDTGLDYRKGGKRKPYLSYRRTPSSPRINFVVFSGSVRGWPRCRWSEQLCLTVLWQANKNINLDVRKSFFSVILLVVFSTTSDQRSSFNFRSWSTRGGTGEEGTIANKKQTRNPRLFPLHPAHPGKLASTSTNNSTNKDNTQLYNVNLM